MFPHWCDSVSKEHCDRLARGDVSWVPFPHKSAEGTCLVRVT